MNWVSRIFKRSPKTDKRMHLNRRAAWQKAALELPTNAHSDHSFLSAGIEVCLDRDPGFWSRGDARSALSEYYAIHPAWINMLDGMDTEGESFHELGWAMMGMPAFAAPTQTRILTDGAL